MGTCFSSPLAIAIEPPIQMILKFLLSFAIEKASCSCLGVGNVIKIISEFLVINFFFIILLMEHMVIEYDIYLI